MLTDPATTEVFGSDREDAIELNALYSRVILMPPSSATRPPIWGMRQMMFGKYVVVVDDDVNVHNTSEVLFRLCANTDALAQFNFHLGASRCWTMQPLKSRTEPSVRAVQRETDPCVDRVKSPREHRHLHGLKGADGRCARRTLLVVTRHKVERGTIGG